MSLTPLVYRMQESPNRSNTSKEVEQASRDMQVQGQTFKHAGKAAAMENTTQDGTLQSRTQTAGRLMNELKTRNNSGGVYEGMSSRCGSLSSIRTIESC